MHIINILHVGTITIFHIVVILSMNFLLTIQGVMKAYKIEEYKLFTSIFVYVLCLLFIVAIYILRKRRNKRQKNSNQSNEI